MRGGERESKRGRKEMTQSSAAASRRQLLQIQYVPKDTNVSCTISSRKRLKIRLQQLLLNKKNYGYRSQMNWKRTPTHTHTYNTYLANYNTKQFFVNFLFLFSFCCFLGRFVLIIRRHQHKSYKRRRRRSGGVGKGIQFVVDDIMKIGQDRQTQNDRSAN